MFSCMANARPLRRASPTTVYTLPAWLVSANTRLSFGGCLQDNWLFWQLCLDICSSSRNLSQDAFNGLSEWRHCDEANLQTNDASCVLLESEERDHTRSTVVIRRPMIRQLHGLLLVSASYRPCRQSKIVCSGIVHTVKNNVHRVGNSVISCMLKPSSCS